MHASATSRHRLALKNPAPGLSPALIHCHGHIRCLRRAVERQLPPASSRICSVISPQGARKKSIGVFVFHRRGFAFAILPNTPSAPVRGFQAATSRGTSRYGSTLPPQYVLKHRGRHRSPIVAAKAFRRITTETRIVTAGLLIGANPVKDAITFRPRISSSPPDQSSAQFPFFPTCGPAIQPRLVCPFHFKITPSISPPQ